jgi:hypothetical protein
MKRDIRVRHSQHSSGLVFTNTSEGGGIHWDLVEAKLFPSQLLSRTVNQPEPEAWQLPVSEPLQNPSP